MPTPLKNPDATLMHAEAAQAAEVIERQLSTNNNLVAALGQRLRSQPPPFVVTCARGSSDNAATFAKYAIETQLGPVTASASPSAVSIYGVTQPLKGALYIVISQSGESPDLVRSASSARTAGALVIAITNVGDSALARAAEMIIPLHAGPEYSVAATKSFLASLAAVLHLVAHWKNDTALLQALKGTPAALRRAAALDWSSLVTGLKDADHLFVLGRGLMLGAAQEAALKFKETCGLHAEAFSTAEVRHGPMALIGPEFPVLLFAQEDATLPGALSAADEFRARGARVWTAAPGDSHPDTLPLASAPHPLCAPLLTVQSIYTAVNALSLARGRDPDAPPYLHKVTETL
ncbi:MAG TPA: SIS domain-containing protein [Gammaproteobacteria bacterium]|nr:SIS domain-containing protein [Gammaproteobacteria bacterium]